MEEIDNLPREIKLLNDFLLKKGGKSSLDNLPNYRLVWSEDVQETRLGTFRDFTDSGLFIKEVTEIRRVPKYTYIRDRWILEKYFPYSISEIKKSDGYELVWCFESSDREFQRPNERVLGYLLNRFENFKPTKWRSRVEEMKSEEIKQVEKGMEALDITPEDIQYRMGERVSMRTKETVQ